MIPKNTPIKSHPPAALPKWPNILLGGESGVGKTHFLGTVGKGNKVLVFDSEGGEITYSSKAFQRDQHSAYLSDIHVVSLNNFTDPAKLVHEIESNLDYLITSKNTDGFRAVAIDSITELESLFISLDPSKDKRQSYGAFQEALRRLVIKARHVPTYTFFTGRLKAVDDEITGESAVRFAVSPGAWKIIAGLFDATGFFDLKVQGQSTKRTLDFRFRRKMKGKDRLDLGEIIDPNLTDILAQLEGVELEDSEPQAAKKVARKFGGN